MPRKKVIIPESSIVILDDDLLSKLYHQRQNTNITYRELATQVNAGISSEQLRSKLRAYHKSLAVSEIPEPIDPLFDDVLHLDNDQNVIIIADIHTPYQNSGLLRQVYRMARAANIKELDIAGDLHNFAELSSLTRHEKVTPYTTDIAHARELLYSALNVFDRIVIDLGNHDEYYLKKKGGTFNNLIHDVVLRNHHTDRVLVTERDYHLRGDTLMIGHLSSFDENPGLLAKKLAQIHNRTVFVGHDHLRGWQMTDDHNNIGYSIGAMLSPSHFWYKQRRLSTMPPFQLGFILIQDGFIYDFDENGNTNYLGINRTWDEWEEYFKALQ